MKAYDTCYAITQGVSDFYPRTTALNGFCAAANPQQINLGKIQEYMLIQVREILFLC